MREYIRSTNFFGECSWFKFNNLGRALGMILKFHANCAKRVKTKSQNVLGLNFLFVEVTGEKLVANRVIVIIFITF